MDNGLSGSVVAGTIDIVENGTSDVTKYAKANVKVAPTKTLLWTNPNPSTSWTSGTIELDLSSYSGIAVICGTYYNTSPPSTSLPITWKGLAYFVYVEKGTSDTYIPVSDGVDAGRMSRQFTVTDTYVTIGGQRNYSSTSTSPGTESSYAIPYQIYGV